MNSRNPLSQWHQGSKWGNLRKICSQRESNSSKLFANWLWGLSYPYFWGCFLFFPLEKEAKLKEVIKLSFLRARTRPNLIFQHIHPHCIVQRWHEMNSLPSGIRRGLRGGEVRLRSCLISFPAVWLWQRSIFSIQRGW